MVIRVERAPAVLDVLARAPVNHGAEPGEDLKFEKLSIFEREAFRQRLQHRRLRFPPDPRNALAHAGLAGIDHALHQLIKEALQQPNQDGKINCLKTKSRPIKAHHSADVQGSNWAKIEARPLTSAMENWRMAAALNAVEGAINERVLNHVAWGLSLDLSAIVSLCRSLAAGYPMEWNSSLYMKFEKERTRAARDLLAQVPDLAPGSIFDLGCGPGNGTELLAAKFPGARIFGLDISENMLAVARERVPSARFGKEDIAGWRPAEKTDLIFANASLQFVPSHDELMVRLLSYLREGGCLAVQMPNNIQELSHALMRMVAADGPWADRLVPIAKSRAVIGGLDFYYQLLVPHCSRLDLWQTAYVHPLDGPDDIVDWFAGSALRPFLDALSPCERESFLTRYRAELAAAYPVQTNGKVLLRYPRLFFVAQR